MIVVQDLAKKVLIRNSRWPPCPYNWQWCLWGAIQDHYGPLVHDTPSLNDDHCAKLFSNPTMQDKVMVQARFYTNENIHAHLDKVNSINPSVGGIKRKMVKLLPRKVNPVSYLRKVFSYTVRHVKFFYWESLSLLAPTL